MSNRKRKAQTSPDDGSEASRAQRKRVQNRISQKCHRERQAAHARHLESVVDVIKTGDQEGDNASAGDRYTALLRNHMRVIEEKHELEEAIFRMRKKLLSISNSAAAAADDEAVDTLVRSKNQTRRQSELASPSYSPPTTQIEPSNEEPSVTVETKSQNDIALLRKVTIDQPSAAINSQELHPLDLASSQNMSAPTRGLVLPLNSWSSNSEPPDAFIGTVAGHQTPQDQSYMSSFGGALGLTFPLDYPFSIPSPTKTVTVTSPAIFAETILLACRKCLGLRTSEPVDNPAISNEFAAYGWSKEAQDTNNVAQISAIGVQLLAAFAGLTPYLYGVGAASVMESLIRWRLMPTVGNRTSISEPFRPTPLQYSTNDYPHFIDFINWPHIRDQLILQSGTMDIEEIIRDLVQNTVVEIPHRHVSVNVLGLFYNSTFNPGNHIAWNNKLKTAVTEVHWTYLEIPAPPEPNFISEIVDPTPAESALVQEISRRMDSGSNISSPEQSNQLSTIDIISTPRGNSTPALADNLTGSWKAATLGANETVTRFGLDQLTKWKLSREFARKHPFLDCSSAVAAYDMVSAQGALEAF